MISVIDFETTGLLDEKSRDFLRQPGITQIGLVVLDQDLNEIAHLDTLINPEIAAGAWSKEAIETTGITPAQVKDAPSFMGIFDTFANAVRGSLYWGGFNNHFDRGVLWHQLMRYGFEKNFPWPPREIDAMKIANQHINAKGKRGAKWNSLTDAYREITGRELKEAHDALNDVRATAEIIREIGRPLLTF
jgi:DNA polymerase-3 subunit epsilon